ncbi:MAG: NAD(P)-dependent oxidoreductase [Rhodobacteraceae bacterium]|nr:NAD(P)-dependent oxidoreductase [Paracoccaceae bacterium]
MKRYHRILLTGAAGRLGRELRKSLGTVAETVRITDCEAMEDLRPHEEAVVCDLGERQAILDLTRDVDAIVHFGGIACEGTFDAILRSNIIGSYNVYEGARQNGISRIVFASSVHAIGFWGLEDHIDADSPVRPDSLYGVAKTYVESLSRLYWDKFGIESLCLRIFSSFEEPADRRMLWSWLSYDDCADYVRQGLLAPRVGHTIAFGISKNAVRPVDNSKAGHIGWTPRDSSEPYRRAVENTCPPPDPNSVGARTLGGWFCELGHPDDTP